MRIFSTIETYQSADPVVLSIGNFDGLHRGHQFLIQKNLELASQLKARTVVLTFYPHPLQVLKPELHFVSLSNQVEQALSLEQFGVDDWISEPFSESVREEQPEAFWHRLMQFIPIKGIVVGPDFRFGKDRSGDVTLLQNFCFKSQVKLFIPEPYVFKGQRVSSTLIRQLLLKGEVVSANDFLGRAYSIKGNVISGFKRGRQLGFPTANINSEQALNLKPGVYNSMVSIRGEKKKAATNVGYHPTVGDEMEIQIESHILDFDEYIYGEELRVEFLEFIRPEVKFSSLELLKEQIHKDIQRVRQS